MKNKGTVPIVVLLALIVVSVISIGRNLTVDDATTDVGRFYGKDSVTLVADTDQPWYSFKVTFFTQPFSVEVFETLLSTDDSSYNVGCDIEPMGDSEVVQCQLQHFRADHQPTGRTPIAHISGDLSAIEGPIEVVIYDPTLGVPIEWGRENYEVIFE